MQITKKSINTTLKTILSLNLIAFAMGCAKKNLYPSESEVLFSEQFSNRIVGGKPVLPKSAESLSTVALYFSLDGLQPNATNKIVSFCTGTLIDPSIVMTAAHCLVDFTKQVNTSLGTQMTIPQATQRMQIGFGLTVAKSAISQTVPFRKIASFVVHKQYVADSVQEATTKPMYDIALLKLDSPSPAEYKPVALVEDPTLIKNGKSVTLVGFGLLKANPVQRTDKMMQVNVTIANPNINETQWTYNVSRGKSSCSGDSGGPAYMTLTDGSLAVAGVTSWGDSMCTRMGAYTSVPVFASWIKTNITNLKASVALQ